MIIHFNHFSLILAALSLSFFPPLNQLCLTSHVASADNRCFLLTSCSEGKTITISCVPAIMVVIITSGTMPKKVPTLTERETYLLTFSFIFLENQNVYIGFICHTTSCLCDLWSWFMHSWGCSCVSLLVQSGCWEISHGPRWLIKTVVSTVISQ